MKLVLAITLALTATTFGASAQQRPGIYNPYSGMQTTKTTTCVTRGNRLICTTK